ncbi:MAG: uracil-DNA glycosylase [Pseudomonadota bacterium]
MNDFATLNESSAQTTTEKKVQLDVSWLKHLSNEFNQDYMKKLKIFLKNEIDQGKVIYPKRKDWFNALNTTKLPDVRVVILGQDPYHGPNQAHGYCFSVPKNIAVPPSLKNIFQETNKDAETKNGAHGNLISWANQGVLLLNSVLTVEAHKAAAHANLGWEIFTDRIMEVINRECRDVVFLLWGSYAQRKAHIIDSSKHTLLQAPHPSPLSAHRGFLGCQHFSKANSILIEKGYQAIDWQIPV